MILIDLEHYCGDVCFDIIIDDGSHILQSQIFAINLLLPRLKSDGLFIIEDIRNIDAYMLYFKNYEKLIPSLDVEIVDRRKLNNRYDDVLVVIRKKH